MRELFESIYFLVCTLIASVVYMRKILMANITIIWLLLYCCQI